MRSTEIGFRPKLAEVEFELESAARSIVASWSTQSLLERLNGDNEDRVIGESNAVDVFRSGK